VVVCDGMFVNQERVLQMHGAGKPVIIAGNKLDAENEREVSEEEGEEGGWMGWEGADWLDFCPSTFFCSLSVRSRAANWIF
jgi:hypothetical protein